MTDQSIIDILNEHEKRIDALEASFPPPLNLPPGTRTHNPVLSNAPVAANIGTLAMPNPQKRPPVTMPDFCAPVAADKPKLGAIAVFQNDDGTIDYQLSLTNGILFVDEKDGQITDIMHAFGGTSVEYHHEARVAEAMAELAAERAKSLELERQLTCMSRSYAPAWDQLRCIEPLKQQVAELKDRAEKFMISDDELNKACNQRDAARSEAAQWKERAEKAEAARLAMADSETSVAGRMMTERDAARAEADALAGLLREARDEITQADQADRICACCLVPILNDAGATSHKEWCIVPRINAALGGVAK